MKFLMPLAFLLLSSNCTAEEIKTPVGIRQGNYGPSCVHAATITMLRWQGQSELASWWRKSYYGGEYFSELNNKADRAGLRYASTLKGNICVLNYANNTRRGAVISWSGKSGGYHAVFFCGFSDRTATIVDPNTKKVHVFDKAKFLLHWRSCGGRAFTTLYSPPPKL